MLSGTVEVLLTSLTFVCIYTDLRRGRIYNAVLGPAVLAGLGYHLYTAGPAGLWFCCKGLVLGLLLLFIPFALGGVGGGDVKFLAAVGALGGPAFVWRAFLYGALIGGALALGVLVYRRELLRVLKKLWGLLYARLLHLPPVETLGTLDDAPGGRLPYGLALGLGVMAALYLRF